MTHYYLHSFPWKNNTNSQLDVPYIPLDQANRSQDNFRHISDKDIISSTVSENERALFRLCYLSSLDEITNISLIWHEANYLASAFLSPFANNNFFLAKGLNLPDPYQRYWQILMQLYDAESHRLPPYEFKLSDISAITALDLAYAGQTSASYAILDVLNHLSQRDITTQVVLPTDMDPRLDNDLSPFLQTLYHFHDANLEILPEISSSPRSLFKSKIFNYETPTHDAHALAKYLVNLINQGLDLAQIAIIIPQTKLRHHYARILNSYQLPIVTSSQGLQSLFNRLLHGVNKRPLPLGQCLQAWINICHDGIGLSLLSGDCGLQKQLVQVTTLCKILLPQLNQLHIFSEQHQLQNAVFTPNMAANYLSFLLNKILQQNLPQALPGTISLCGLDTLPTHDYTYLFFPGFTKTQFNLETSPSLFPLNIRNTINQQLNRPLLPSSPPSINLLLWRALQLTSQSYVSYFTGDTSPTACSPYASIFTPPLEADAGKDTWTLNPLAYSDAESIEITNLWEKYLPSVYTLLSPLGEKIVEIENARYAWFENNLLSSDYLHYMGKIPPLPNLGTASFPFSSTMLDDYAQCPFRFFVRHILNAAQSSSNEDVSTRTLGQLQHALLAQLIPKYETTALSESALDEMIRHYLQIWHQRQAWYPNAALENITTQAAQQIKSFLQSLPSPPNHIFLTEQRFGPFPIQPKADDAVLYFIALIDFIDKAPSSIRIIDFKSSGFMYFDQRLGNNLLGSSFQLPLYILAVYHSPLADNLLKSGDIQAYYYSIAEDKLSTAVDFAQIQTLETTLHAKAAQLKKGDFFVQPRHCRHCEFRAICRIPKTILQEMAESDNS